MESIDSNTQTAVISTEHELVSDTSLGVFILIVDTSNMVLGDIVTLRIKTKCIATGSSELAYTATFAHLQNTNNKFSVPVPSVVEIVCTLEQTDGTARDFDWNLLKA